LRALIEGNREEHIALWKRIESKVTDPEGMVYQARTLSFVGETKEAVLLLERALDHGFNPYRVLVRSDSFLDGARSQTDFPRLLERARQKYLAARQAFIDAGGERLLGVSVPAE
jgi:hypothetical protein